jgi:hypothetical protein
VSDSPVTRASLTGLTERPLTVDDSRAVCARSRRPRPGHPAGLSTDSRTGALGLYEKVGMEVTSVWLNRAIDL